VLGAQLASVESRHAPTLTNLNVAPKRAHREGREREKERERKMEREREKEREREREGVHAQTHTARPHHTTTQENPNPAGQDFSAFWRR
jgi:hypothetical protein